MKLIAACIFFFLLIFLYFSVIRSGYGYMYDIDEISHTQKIFLLANGYKPYTDFFSIYSPIFHWLMKPVFLVSGFTLETIKIARIIMIGLFSLRFFLTTLIVYKIFGRNVMLFFVPLFLIDQNGIFAGMQIRPDNLMLTLFIFGIFILVFQEEEKYYFSKFLAGVALSLAFLTSIKISPSILVAIGLYFILSIIKKNLLTFFSLLMGFLLPICLFLGYFLLNHSIVPAIEQIFIYPKFTNDTVLLDAPFGYFFRPDYYQNWIEEGKVFAYLAIIALPYLCVGGIFLQLKQLFKTIKQKYRRLKFMLLGILLFQTASLLTIKSAFIQYYLPITWIMSLYAAVFFEKIAHINFNKVMKFMLFLSIFILFIFTTMDNIEINNQRSKRGPDKFIKLISKRWSQIPPKEHVFPNILFRFPVYPIICCYLIRDLPETLLKKFPAIDDVLELNKVKYLFFEDNHFSYLPIKVRYYIDENYERLPTDPEFWVRKTTK